MSSTDEEFIDALNLNLRTFACLPSLSVASGEGQNQKDCEETKGCNWVVCTDSEQGCTQGKIQIYCTCANCVRILYGPVHGVEQRVRFVFKPYQLL